MPVQINNNTKKKHTKRNEKCVQSDNFHFIKLLFGISKFRININCYFFLYPKLQPNSVRKTKTKSKLVLLLLLLLCYQNTKTAVNLDKFYFLIFFFFFLFIHFYRSSFQSCSCVLLFVSKNFNRDMNGSNLLLLQLLLHK